MKRYVFIFVIISRNIHFEFRSCPFQYCALTHMSLASMVCILCPWCQQLWFCTSLSRDPRTPNSLGSIKILAYRSVSHSKRSKRCGSVSEIGSQSVVGSGLCCPLYYFHWQIENLSQEGNSFLETFYCYPWHKRYYIFYLSFIHSAKQTFSATFATLLY